MCHWWLAHQCRTRYDHSMRPHKRRKRVKRFNNPGHAHLLTFSCQKRMPLLTEESRLQALARSIDSATLKYDFRLAAFVFMPEHVHLVLVPSAGEYDISKLLSAIKRPFSYRVKRELELSADPLLSALTVRERPGRSTFRFWLEGGGHDRNIVVPAGILKSAEYIHNNPVRRGLCASPDEWKWSSWKYYHQPTRYEATALPRVDGLGNA